MEIVGLESVSFDQSEVSAYLASLEFMDSKATSGNSYADQHFNCSEMAILGDDFVWFPGVFKGKSNNTHFIGQLRKKFCSIIYRARNTNVFFERSKSGSHR